MYFPLVRGKQFELVALRELADVIPHILFKPIIEPVRENYAPLVKTIEVLNEKNIIPLVIVNPSLGDFTNSAQIITAKLKEINNEIDFVPCFKTKEYTVELEEALDRIDSEKAVYVYDKVDAQNITLLKKSNYAIVPADAPIGALKNLQNIILMDDPFQKKRKNADYEAESYFSDLHTSYKNKGLSVLGFGDYTIVGSDYSETGGPAYVVTIHMSYIDSDNFDSMSIKHFSSQNNNSIADPGGKFLEALGKFYQFQSRNPKIFDDTIGKLELLNLYNRKQYPGLGIIKKLSIEHHMQTICNYLIWGIDNA